MQSYAKAWIEDYILSGKEPRKLGVLRDQYSVPDDIDSLNEEIAAMFDGEIDDE